MQPFIETQSSGELERQHEDNRFKVQVIEAMGKAMKESGVNSATLNISAGSSELVLKFGEATKEGAVKPESE